MADFGPYALFQPAVQIAGIAGGQVFGRERVGVECGAVGDQVFPGTDVEKLFVDLAVLFPFEGLEKPLIVIEPVKWDSGAEISYRQLNDCPGENIQKDGLNRIEKNYLHIVSTFI